MRFKTHEEEIRLADTGDPGGEGGTGLAGEAADRMVAADAIVQRHLSGNAEAYLRANRQEGGQ
jgi:hypothetical protein